MRGKHELAWREPRDQRRAAGLVAQYIHELSDRHARAAAAGHPRQARGADQTGESR
jgi:hypothetical protein